MIERYCYSCVVVDQYSCITFGTFINIWYGKTFNGTMTLVTACTIVVRLEIRGGNIVAGSYQVPRVVGSGIP